MSFVAAALTGLGTFAGTTGGAALLGAGATLGAGALSKGGGGGVGYSQVPETKEAIEARKRLLGFATGEPPAVPLRERAPFEPMELKEFPERKEFLELPEVQGIIQEATASGNLLANRLSRMLQSAGALTTTPGRDVLGRATTDIQKSLASSLAPFAMEERARGERQFGVEQAFDLSEQARRMGMTEAEFTDRYQKELAESRQLETFTIPLLQSIIGTQPAIQPYLQGQGTSGISQISELIGPLLAGILKSGSPQGAALGAGVSPGAAATATGRTPSGGFIFG